MVAILGHLRLTCHEKHGYEWEEELYNLHSHVPPKTQGQWGDFLYVV